MNDDTASVMVGWQQILEQAQALAARLPEIGLSPDKLALLPFDELLGILAFLKRLYAEREE
jgi:hypothetical protein